jgi:hypothetical protein
VSSFFFKVFYGIFEQQDAKLPELIVGWLFSELIVGWLVW